MEHLAIGVIINQVMGLCVPSYHFSESSLKRLLFSALKSLKHWSAGATNSENFLQL